MSHSKLQAGHLDSQVQRCIEDSAAHAPRTLPPSTRCDRAVNDNAKLARQGSHQHSTHTSAIVTSTDLKHPLRILRAHMYTDLLKQLLDESDEIVCVPMCPGKDVGRKRTELVEEGLRGKVEAVTQEIGIAPMPRRSAWKSWWTKPSLWKQPLELMTSSSVAFVGTFSSGPSTWPGPDKGKKLFSSFLTK